MIQSASICALIAVFLLAGCAQNPAASLPASTSRSANLVAREKVALQHIEKGRFAEALIQWKILLTLEPTSTHYQARVRQSEAGIVTLSAQRLRAGDAALDKGDSATARREWLAVLALDPGNNAALENLRNLEFDRVWRIQSTKLERLKTNEDRKADTNGGGEQERFYFELGTLMFRAGDFSGTIREIQKYLNSYPGDVAAKKLIAEAYAKLAAQQRQQGQLQNALENMQQAKRFNRDPVVTSNKAEQEVRHALAEEYFEKGLRAQRSDLNLAIESWEKTLELNPQHPKARTKLNEALRMQKNWKEIGR